MRDRNGLDRLQDILRAVQHAFRRLRESSGVTAATILTWAVGMAAMTTILGIVNAFMFRPMPVDHPDRIVSISTGADDHVSLPHGLSFRDLEDYRRDETVFVDLVGYQPASMTLTVDEAAERIATYVVTDNYFSVLGVQAAVGRLLQKDEGRARGDAPVLVLSHRFWQSRFGASPSVVGARVRLNGRPFTIVGVTSATFDRAHSFIQPAAYVPVWMRDDLMNAPPGTSILEGRDNHQLWVLGRLKPGVSLDEARASLQVIARRLGQEYPTTNTSAQLVVVPETHARPTPNAGQLLWTAGSVFGALALLLFLLASTNAANLVVAGALRREREVIIRAALGAPRHRLVSQLLMDSVLLAVLANVIAMPLSQLALRGLEQWMARGGVGVAVRPDFSLDARLLGITFVLAIGAGAGAGIAPALFMTRPGIGGWLNQGRSVSGGHRSGRLRKGLLIAQVALSFLLLVSGGLFVRSLWNAQTIRLGFDSQGVLLASASPRDAAYDANRRLDFYTRAVARVMAVPGVESAGWTSWAPFSTSPRLVRAWLERESPQAGGQAPRVPVAHVSPEYLATLRVRLLDGRSFDASDNQNSRNVGIINQALARRFWPNQNPIGRTVTVEGTPVAVVGIVEDGKYIFIWESPQPMLFRPVAQEVPSSATMVVRSARSGANLLIDVERALRTVDPLVGIFRVRSMSDYLDEQGSAFLAFRLGAVVTTLFGVAGLLLASTGLYGLMASEVRHRRRDIGVRLALGAPLARVLRNVLGQAARVAFIGVVAGAALAAPIAKRIEPLLLDVSAVDLFTYIAVGVVLISTCEMASFVPAVRAARVDPATVLRVE